MDRAYKSGAVASPPAATDNTSVGYPTAGNPQTGEMPTKPGPYWYHMMTEELVNVLAAAGITPDKASTDQLLTALQSMFVHVGGDSMTGNLTLPELRVGDANARIRRDGTSLAVENDVERMTLSTLTGVQHAANAKMSGGVWNRIDTAQPAKLLINDRTQGLIYYTAPAGANPIAWSGPYKVWHANNDGQDSGLNADLLRGLIADGNPTGNSVAVRGNSGALAVADPTAAAHALTLGLLTGTLAGNGYIKIPIWSAGARYFITLQWGGITVPASGSLAVTFPVGFPTTCWGVLFGRNRNGGGYTLGYDGLSTTGFTAYNLDSFAATHFYIALGGL